MTLLQQVVVDDAEGAARRARFPVGAAIEFADLEEAGREDALDRMREVGALLGDAIDVRRTNARHHRSFSFGEHHCLGTHLTRIEVAAALERILALPGLRLKACEEPAGFAFRRPATLELAWG